MKHSVHLAKGAPGASVDTCTYRPPLADTAREEGRLPQDSKQGQSQHHPPGQEEPDDKLKSGSQNQLFNLRLGIPLLKALDRQHNPLAEKTRVLVSVETPGQHDSTSLPSFLYCKME